MRIRNGRAVVYNKPGILLIGTALVLFSCTFSAFAQSDGDTAFKVQAVLERGARLLDEKKPEEAEPLLRQATTLDPQHAITWFYLGNALMAQRKYEGAGEAMGQALKLDAQKAALSRRQRREALDALGLSYGLAGNYAKAQSVYKEAMAKEPDYAGLPYNLACICSLSGDRSCALDALRSALGLVAKGQGGIALPDPSTDEDFKGLWGDPVFQAILVMNLGPQPDDGAGGALVREGARLLAIGDAQGASPKLEEALKIDPLIVKGWYAYGGALEILGKLPESVAAFRKALELNVAPRAALNKPMIRYCAFHSGQGYLGEGRFEEAVKALAAAEAADPSFAMAFYEEARARAGLDDRTSAQSALKKARALELEQPRLAPVLPDPAKDPAFAKWSTDKAWAEFLLTLQ